MDEQIASKNLPRTRVLVVDDHPSTAATLARAISQLGPEIEVLSATSGKMALEQIGDDAVDLLITDMMMPDMNGLELIEHLQSHPAGSPSYTILITAYDVPGLKESARRLKVNETIIKPFRPEHICQIVGKVLEEMGNSKSPEQTTDARQPFKILIADDIADNITLLSRYFKNEGFIFVTASNGMETLEKTRAEMPDLILLDINMPEKDGFEVLKEIRSDPVIQHIPVIILTAARPDAVAMEFGLNLGADDYVTKPFDRRELLARIRTKLRAKEVDEIIRRRYKELSVLPEIGKDFSARLNFNELIDLVLRRSVETLGAMLGHIVILDPAGSFDREYRISKSTIPAFEILLPPVNVLLEQLKENQQGVIIDDTHLNAHWQSISGNPSCSAIIVPISGRLKMIGFLVLIHEKTGYFNPEYQLLLQAIASQAAIAMENAQLYANLAQERQQLDNLLQDAAHAIVIFDGSERLKWFNLAGEKLFANSDAKPGNALTQGDGYDPLLELLEEVLAAREARIGEILWPDGHSFTAFLTPMQDGGCVALLYKLSVEKRIGSGW